MGSTYTQFETTYGSAVDKHYQDMVTQAAQSKAQQSKAQQSQPAEQRQPQQKTGDDKSFWARRLDEMKMQAKQKPSLGPSYAIRQTDNRDPDVKAQKTTNEQIAEVTRKEALSDNATAAFNAYNALYQDLSGGNPSKAALKAVGITDSTEITTASGDKVTFGQLSDGDKKAVIQSAAEGVKSHIEQETQNGGFQEEAQEMLDEQNKLKEEQARAFEEDFGNQSQRVDEAIKKASGGVGEQLLAVARNLRAASGIQKKGQSAAVTEGDKDDTPLILASARHHLDHAKYVNASARWVDKGSGLFGVDWGRIGGKGLLVGAGEEVLDPTKWTFGVSDAMEGTLLNGILDKRDKGEPLTAAEQSLLDATALDLATQAMNAKTLGHGYKIGNVAGGTAAFIAQIAIAPSAGLEKKVAQSLTGKLTKYVMKKYAAQFAKSEAAGGLVDRVAGRLIQGANTSTLRKALKTGAVVNRFAGRAVEGAAFTNTIGAPEMLNEVYSDVNGRAAVGGGPDPDKPVEEWTPYRITGREGGGQSPAGALLRRELTGTVGYVGFTSGGDVQRLTSVVWGELGKGATRMGLGGLVRGIRSMSNSALSKALERWHFSGSLSNQLSMSAADVVNTLIEGGSPKDALDKDQLVDRFFGFLVVDGLKFAAGGRQAVLRAKEQDQRIAGLYEGGKDVWKNNKDAWETLNNSLSALDPDKLSEAVKGVLADGNLTKEEKRQAVLLASEYARKIGQSESAMRVADTFGRVENETLAQETDGAREGARLADGGDKKGIRQAWEEYNLLRTRLAELGGDDLLAAVDGDPYSAAATLHTRGGDKDRELEALVKQYTKAYSKIYSALSSGYLNINAAAEAEKVRTRGFGHTGKDGRSDGTIVSGRLKDGRKVYVRGETGGDVLFVTDEDGKISSVSRSDLDGELETRKLSDVEAEIDARRGKSHGDFTKEMAAFLGGRLDFYPGDKYTLDIGGKEEEIEIVGPCVDPSNGVEDTSKVMVRHQDGDVDAVSRAYIEQQAGLARMNELADLQEKRRKEEPKASEDESEEETGLRQGDKVTFELDGEEQEGEITQINEDEYTIKYTDEDGDIKYVARKKEDLKPVKGEEERAGETEGEEKEEEKPEGEEEEEKPEGEEEEEPEEEEEEKEPEEDNFDYEAADPQSVVEKLLKDNEGSLDDTADIAASMLDDARGDLEKAVKAAKGKIKGRTVQEKLAEKARLKEAVKQERKRVEHWQGVVDEVERRRVKAKPEETKAEETKAEETKA
ncbi:MAG: hypothetical protein LUC33_04445, partial [Prevotellaceae bacterium]|nr:hypothetical protein [Prevotellaceae bacterium]